MKRFFIVDGHSLIYRACYSPAPMLRSADGEPTKGPFLFLRSLLRLAREWGPIDYLVVALDSPRETLRRRLVDPNYKMGRGTQGPSEEVKQQFRLSLRMLRELAVPTVEVRGWEADDIIATLVRKFSNHNLETFVVSSDKDLHQVVNDHVSCLDVFSGVTWGPEDVERKWGVPPHKVVEVQTLAGDPTDGVVGVRGVGPARAAELVRLFGSAEQVRRSWGKIASGNYGSRRGCKALKHITEAQLKAQRDLVKLDQMVPLPFHKLDELSFSTFELSRARPLFVYLGFRQWTALEVKSGSRSQASRSSTRSLT